ncbi:MAG: alpha/beta fold hydrolase [Chloroflexota bacterium]
MDVEKQKALQKARDHLRAGEKPPARAILVQFVKQDQQVEAAWYLLGFALEDPKQQAYAFQQVLRINPGNQKARVRLQALSAPGRADTPATAPVEPPRPRQPEPQALLKAVEKELPEPPRSAAGVPGSAVAARPGKQVSKKQKAASQPAPAKAETKAKPRRRGRISPGLLLAVGGLLVVLLVGGGLGLYWLVSQGALGQIVPLQTATVVAQASTAPPTLTATATPVLPTPTPSATSTASATPTQAADVIEFRPGECRFAITIQADIECGSVLVPERRDGQLSGRVHLAVAIFHSLSQTPKPDPVIYLHGGPGGATLQSIAHVEQSFILPLLEERDLIVFDQRGVGYSQPSLDCPDVWALYRQDLYGSLAQFNTADLYEKAFQECRDRLVYSGVDIEHYTTANSAADVRDIARALGYEQVNLYGVSYGTNLALSVMRDYPEIVRSAVLDSVLPLEVKSYNDQAANAAEALQTLFAGCAADPLCQEAYPDLEKVFYELVDRMEAEPLEVPVTDPASGLTHNLQVSGNGLINAVIWGLHAGDGIPAMPKGIYDLAEGDPWYLSQIKAVQAGYLNSISIGVMASINCHEQVYATTPQELEADLEAEPRFAAYARSAMFGGVESLFAICSRWKVLPFDPASKQALKSDIPALILAGEYDPTTPLHYGRQVHENLSHSYLVAFAGQGHAPTWSPEVQCATQIALDFLNTPSRAPDSACAKPPGGMHFAVAYTGKAGTRFETFYNDQYGLSGVIPSGWRSIGSGFYNRLKTDADPTQVGLQSSAVSIPEWLDWLTVKFQNVGLDAAPKAAGEHEANGSTWELYTSTFRGNPVDLAFTQVEGQTILVAMLSPKSEHTALYQNIFLELVERVRWVE